MRSGGKLQMTVGFDKKSPEKCGDNKTTLDTIMPTTERSEVLQEVAQKKKNLLYIHIVCVISDPVIVCTSELLSFLI